MSLALGVTLVWFGSIGCRDAKKEEAPPPSASASIATAPVVAPSTSASVAVADPPPEPLKEDVGDAGADAGRRKLRRLVAGVPDAGPLEVTETVAAAAPAPAPAPASAPAPPQSEAAARGAKRPSTQMGDDLPYGGATGSAAPVLKKTPLAADDPWAKPAPK